MEQQSLEASGTGHPKCDPQCHPTVLLVPRPQAGPCEISAGAEKGERCSNHIEPPMSLFINCINCGVISGRNPTLWKGEPRTLNYAAKHSYSHGQSSGTQSLWLQI